MELWNYKLQASSHRLGVLEGTGAENVFGESHIRPLFARETDSGNLCISNSGEVSSDRDDHQLRQTSRHIV